MKSGKSKKSKKITQGFTLVELLLVIAIITIAAAAAFPFGVSFLARNNLKNKTNEVVESLRIAQLNSLSGKQDSKWGVHIDSSQIVMFMGDSYVPPGSDFDQRYDIPSTISITPVDIVFDKLNGNSSSIATITISNNISETNTVNVNEVGVMDVY